MLPISMDVMLPISINIILPISIDLMLPISIDVILPVSINAILPASIDFVVRGWKARSSNEREGLMKRTALLARTFHPKSTDLARIFHRKSKEARSSEYGTHKTVKARLWPWLSGKCPHNHSSYSLFARKRQGACLSHRTYL